MLHQMENPVSLPTSRVLENISFASNVENTTENLIELQADWLIRRYPISRDHARLVAGLYFGGAARVGSGKLNR